MAEITRNSGNSGNMGTGAGNSGHTGGRGYSGGSEFGGTGGNDPLGPDRRSDEPRSNAAVWIVAIVVVIGALAIWIARNTNDDTDRMQSRPGVEQNQTDRDLNRSGTGTTSDPYREGATGQGNNAMDAQRGTGTIPGDSQDPRMENNDAPASNAAPVGAGTTGTGTDTRGTGTSSEGVGTRPTTTTQPAGSSITGSSAGSAPASDDQ